MCELPGSNILQQPSVHLQHMPERLVGDGASLLRVRVLEHGGRQLQELGLAELHAVLFHADSHHVLELSVLNEAVV